jgi:hypothetical protein
MRMPLCSTAVILMPDLTQHSLRWPPAGRREQAHTADCSNRQVVSTRICRVRRIASSRSRLAYGAAFRNLLGGTRCIRRILDGDGTEAGNGG